MRTVVILSLALCSCKVTEEAKLSTSKSANAAPALPTDEPIRTGPPIIISDDIVVEPVVVTPPPQPDPDPVPDPVIVWAPAPLAVGGFARATTVCDAQWQHEVDGVMTLQRIEAGSVHPILANGLTHDTKEIWALDLGAGLWSYFPAICLEGVSPSS